MNIELNKSGVFFFSVTRLLATAFGVGCIIAIVLNDFNVVGVVVHPAAQRLIDIISMAALFTVLFGAKDDYTKKEHYS